MNNVSSPRNDDESIEQEIQRKGLNAPRLRPKDIQAAIKDCAFYVFPGSMLTVCCLTLQNGFTVTGESACASPANFDAEVGQKVAYQNATNKIWVLEGYRLVQRLHEAKRPFEQSETGVYSGTKTLKAQAMTRGEYNTYRGWTIPDDEDQDEAGYLVEYSDGGKSNDARHIGYISWSPADVFERTYRAA